MRLRYYIFLLLCLFILSCSKDRIISRGDMSKIYAELFLADQWLLANNMNDAADTVCVYYPILNKYSYTEADFARSVSYYASDVEDFKAIIEGANSLLKTMIGNLDVQIEEERKKQEWNRRIKRLYADKNLFYTGTNTISDEALDIIFPYANVDSLYSVIYQLKVRGKDLVTIPIDNYQYHRTRSKDNKPYILK